MNILMLILGVIIGMIIVLVMIIIYLWLVLVHERKRKIPYDDSDDYEGLRENQLQFMNKNKEQ